MIKIENKTTNIQISDGPKITYAELLMACVNKPIAEGIDLKTMKRDLRIFGIIEEKIAASKLDAVSVNVSDHTDTMVFSKEDFEHIVTLVENSKWNISHIDILEFAEYIESLK